MSRAVIGILIIFLFQIFSSLIIYDKELTSSEESIFQTNELDCINLNITLFREIHVDNQLGNDNFPGTAECPFNSVLEALKISKNGDTIIIHEGVYHEEIILNDFENLTILLI